jgi:iron complex outermembrane receptor protein
MQNSWNLDDGSKINWITNYVNIDADDPGGLTRVKRKVILNKWLKMFWITMLEKN